MKAIGALMNGLNERMNPLVLKELRQAVRSRFVAVVLMLFLAVLLLIISVYVMASNNLQADMSAGREVFMGLQVALLITTLLFTASYCGIRMAVERSQANMDLLFITTARPSSIIWGKFVAGLALTMMIFASAAPFMVLTYLLRGIDVPTVLFILAVDLLAILTVMQAAMLVGAMPTGLVLKVILALLLLAGVIMTFGTITGVTTSTLFMGLAGLFDPGTFWPIFGSITLSVLGGVGILFFLTVACVSPPSSNRALAPRVFVTGLWLVTGLVFGGLWYTQAIPGGIVAVVGWALGSLALFFLAMFIGISERDVLGRRLRSEIPRNPIGRALVFPFYSGAAAGLFWAGALSAVTIVVTWIAMNESTGAVTALTSGAERRAMVAAMVAIPLFGLCYPLTANAIRLFIGRHRVKTVITGPLALALVAVACAVPPLVVFLIDPMGLSGEHPAWLLVNPMVVFWFMDSVNAGAADNTNYRILGLMLLSVWFGLVLMVNTPWLLGQVRQFKPLSADKAQAPQETEAAPAAGASDDWAAGAEPAVTREPGQTVNTNS